jgi:ankyrin repeat protein
MHEAAYYGHADVLQLLASHGAIVNAANKVLSTIIEIGLAARALLLFMVFLISVCL